MMIHCYSALLVLCSITMVVPVTLAHGEHVDDDAVDADHHHHDPVDASFTGGVHAYLRESGVWMAQRGFLAESAKRVAAVRGWDTEVDEFVIHMIAEVTSIPPWDGESRLQKAVEVLASRYQLTSTQSESVSDLISGVSADWLMTHDDALGACTLDAMEARAGGELITPELAALWTRQATEPLEDIAERFRYGIRRLLPELTPDQRKQIMADVRIINKRQNAMISTAEQWGIGDWSEDMWGLDRDPIQQKAKAQLEEAITKPAAQTSEPSAQSGKVAEILPASSQPQEMDNWGKYVQAFIKRYSLNDQQEQSAWRIHKRAIMLRRQAEARFDKRLEMLKKREAAKTAGGKRFVLSTQGQREYAVRELFNRMKSQLEKIPTRKQRELVDGKEAQSLIRK